MKAKEIRQNAIREIITSQTIGSQEELQRALTERGIQTVQATLSRDLRQLRVVKSTNAKGEYAYVQSRGVGFVSSRGTANVEGADVRFSGNLAVVHTRPGHAGSLAYLIDQEQYADILGSVAGDDTILLVLAENASREEIRQFIAQVTNTANS